MNRYEKLLGKASDNVRIRFSGYGAYVYVNMVQRKSKLRHCSKMDIYLWSRDGLFQAYLPQKRCVASIENVIFGKEGGLLSRKQCKELLAEEGQINLSLRL